MGDATYPPTLIIFVFVTLELAGTAASTAKGLDIVGGLMDVAEGEE